MNSKIQAFEEDKNISKLKDLYFYRTVPEIFGISRSELAHSSFLAWFLNPLANEIGSEPLRKLFSLCELKADYVRTPISISNCIVDTEHAVKVRRNKGRIDVLIICDAEYQDGSIKRTNIIIENKVYSSEHGSQTEIYHSFFEQSKYRSEDKIYIFLTPPGHCHDADCVYYIHLTYQDILDNILTPTLKELSNNERIRFILREYIRSLTVPVDVLTNCNGAISIKSTVLAITMEERELLTEFWEKHKDLIQAAISVISEDGASPYKKEATKCVNALRARDYSKFSVNGDGRYGKARMAEKVISKYVEMHPDISVGQLKLAFPDHLQGSMGVVKSINDNVRDPKRWYKHSLPNGEDYYIIAGWADNIHNFIAHVNGNIDGIEITSLE